VKDWPYKAARVIARVDAWLTERLSFDEATATWEEVPGHVHDWEWSSAAFEVVACDCGELRIWPARADADPDDVQRMLRAMVEWQRRG
jgi:hypothetical protein